MNLDRLDVARLVEAPVTEDVTGLGAGAEEHPATASPTAQEPHSSRWASRWPLVCDPRASPRLAVKRPRPGG